MTNVGLVRKDNEDSYLVSVSRGLFIVADGMGGHLAGQVASSMAVRAFEREFECDFLEEPVLKLRGALLQANETILREGQAHEEYAGMGTTVTAAYIKENYLYLAHIGDSRAYLFRNSSLQQLTQDHSLVNELFQNGSISREEMQNHPQKNILTRAAGTEKEPQIDDYSYVLYPGDILLLCTDGLHGHVKEKDIELILGENLSLEAKLHQMVELSLERGGSDNITAILLEY
jgi:protein phosphatase